MNDIKVFGSVLRLFELVSSLNGLGVLELFGVDFSKDLDFLNQTIDFFFQLEKVVFLGLLILEFFEFLLHLTNFDISGYHLLLKQCISWGEFSKLIFKGCNVVVFLLDFFFGHFNIFDDGEIVIFSHVDHVSDIFDFFVHVNGHGGHYFANVFSPLLVVLLHHIVLFVDFLRD